MTSEQLAEVVRVVGEMVTKVKAAKPRETRFEVAVPEDEAIRERVLRNLRGLYEPPTWSVDVAGKTASGEPTAVVQRRRGRG